MKKSRFGWLALLGMITFAVGAQEHDHAHHQLSKEQFAELRAKVPLYRELTDQQILDNMARMGPNHRVYLSDPKLQGTTAVLALGHGYVPRGNAIFEEAFAGTAARYPTAAGFGMAMMTSEHIQTALDELGAAGAETILVIPVTTLETGGLIGQWRYIFGLQEEAPWMSVKRARSDARIVLGPTPTGGAMVSSILLDYALELSSDPAAEAVAIIGHGPDNTPANQQELEKLEQHAAALRRNGQFVDVHGFSLQDDAPAAVRLANVSRIRQWITSHTEQGHDVILLTTLPVTGSIHKKLRSDLAGLEFSLHQKGILEHPRFTEWVDEVIASVDR